MRVKIRPGRGRNEGQLVGRDANDVATILVVQVSEPVREGAVEGGGRDGDFGCACEDGAREGGERVQVDVVEGFEEGVEERLRCL